MQMHLGVAAWKKLVRRILYVDLDQKRPRVRIDGIRGPHELAFELSPRILRQRQCRHNAVLRVRSIDLRHIDEDAQRVERRDVEDLLAPHYRSRACGRGPARAGNKLTTIQLARGDHSVERRNDALEGL